jgi:hypothetical protein
MRASRVCCWRSRNGRDEREDETVSERSGERRLLGWRRRGMGGISYCPLKITPVCCWSGLSQIYVSGVRSGGVSSSQRSARMSPQAALTIKEGPE